MRASQQSLSRSNFGTIQNLSDVFIDPLRAEYNRVAKILILIEIKDIAENVQGAK